MNAVKLILRLLLFFGLPLYIPRAQASDLVQAPELKDSQGNILRQVVSSAPNGKFTVNLFLQIPPGPPEIVKTDVLTKLDELGYRIETFQYKDGVLDTIQSIPGDVQSFVQYGRLGGSWQQTKTLVLGEEYSPNSNSLSYTWVGTGKFKINSWPRRIPHPDGTNVDIIEVLDKKLPVFPTENDALRNGKPYNPDGELGPASTPNQETKDATASASPKPVVTRNDAAPSVPALIAVIKPHHDWVAWLLAVVAAVAIVVWLVLKKPSKSP